MAMAQACLRRLLRRGHRDRKFVSMSAGVSSLEILFHSIRPEQVENWIQFLRDEGLEFTPVFRQPGQGPTGARLAVVWMPPAGFFHDEDRLEVVFNVGRSEERRVGKEWRAR